LTAEGIQSAMNVKPKEKKTKVEPKAKPEITEET
jgi:hypothetical protein